MNLKACVEKKMDELLEELVENRQDLKHDDPTDTIDVFFDETFNSHEYWWDFDEKELSIRNINELLESYEDMRKEIGETEESLCVDTLIKLYGWWYGHSLKEKYANLLKDAYEHMEEESDDE